MGKFVRVPFPKRTIGASILFFLRREQMVTKLSMDLKISGSILIEIYRDLYAIYLCMYLYRWLKTIHKAEGEKMKLYVMYIIKEP